MRVIGTEKHPIKMWTDGVPVEDGAEEQLRNVANLPFVFRHVAVMPDVHVGSGSTIGCVIPTEGAVSPASVGVDIGCGMRACRSSMKMPSLNKSLWAALRIAIEGAIPAGRTENGRAGDVGAWVRNELPKDVEETWNTDLLEEYKGIVAADPQVQSQNTSNHLGTLGTGNHFIEISFDEEERVWAVLHSGSRGPGNRIGTYFTKVAQDLCDQWFVKLPHRDLAYLPVHSPEFHRYRRAVQWAQNFALLNRDLMMVRVKAALQLFVEGPLEWDLEINCHHNYIAWERHFGKEIIVTRKGAVRAQVGDLAFIPGSMGARSYVVEGLGCRESFNSCSHGAGRVMSRTKAKHTITVADHELATAGVECRKDAEVLDESPTAYKDIDAVMAAQLELVKPIYALKQFVCVKG